MRTDEQAAAQVRAMLWRWGRDLPEEWCAVFERAVTEYAETGHPECTTAVARHYVRRQAWGRVAEEMRYSVDAVKKMHWHWIAPAAMIAVRAGLIAWEEAD